MTNVAVTVYVEPPLDDAWSTPLEAEGSENSTRRNANRGEPVWATIQSSKSVSNCARSCSVICESGMEVPRLNATAGRPPVGEVVGAPDDGENDGALEGGDDGLLDSDAVGSEVVGESDGDVEGDREGDAVGLLVVGERVGEVVGRLVGPAVGLAVVGLTVGLTGGRVVVGLTVGLMVGLAVVGLTVGLMVGSDVVGEIDGDTVGDVVGSEVVGETDGDTVGSEVVGEIDGVTVGSDVVGETDGDVVGSEVVGEIDGDAVGSEVVGEIDGDADGSEVVGEIDGDVVGSDDDDDDDWINTGMGVGGGAPLVGRRSKRARTAVVGTRYTDTASTSSDRDPADADHVQRSALRQEERAGRKRHLAGIKAAMMEATIVFVGGVFTTEDSRHHFLSRCHHPTAPTSPTRRVLCCT